MRLAISGTEIAPEEDVDELLRPAQDLQIDSIELWHPRNTEKQGLEQTLARVSAAGCQIVCVAAGSELYRDGGSVEDQALMLESIRIATLVGAPVVNTYFGHDPLRDDPRAIATYRRLLEPCLRLAERSHVTIVLENEFNAFGVDPAQSDITRRPVVLRQLVEEVASPHFRLNFDACNFYCAGVEPFPYAYEILAPFIGYCHVKDGAWYSALDAVKSTEQWRRFTDYEQQYMMRPLGQGAIPWTALIERLRADGYDGFLTLEPHAETGHREAAWRQAAGYIRQIL